MTHADELGNAEEQSEAQFTAPVGRADTLGVLAALIVAVTAHNRAIVTSDTRLDDLGLDSLDMRDLEMALEDRLDITIPDRALDEAVTVGDIVAAVDKIRARMKA